MYNIINKIKLLTQSILYSKSFNDFGLIFMSDASRQIINNYSITYISTNYEVIHHGKI